MEGRIGFKKNTIDVLNKPVFIVGCPRSGTTWLHRLVISHQEICGGPESGFFHQFWSVLSNLNWDVEASRGGWLLAYWDRSKLKNKIYELWVETFYDFVEHESSSILCEKTPNHALRISNINDLLPEAKFIHIIRDSRSTVASLLSASRSWGNNWAPSTPKKAAILWYQHVKQARLQSADLAEGAYMEVHYEDLKNNTQVEMARVFDFIGVSCTENQLLAMIQEQDFEKQKAMGGSKFSIGNIKAEPLGFFNKGLTDGWRKDLTWLEQLIVWRFTRKLMDECGYRWGGRK